DHVHVDTFLRGYRRTFKRNQSMRLRHRWNDHRFALGQHNRAGSGFRITRAQMAAAFRRSFLSWQQLLGMAVRQPAAFLGDADRHYFVFFFVDGIEDRRCGKQRNFMLTAASAEEYSYPEFLHHKYCKGAFGSQQSGIQRSGFERSARNTKGGRPRINAKRRESIFLLIRIYWRK